MEHQKNKHHKAFTLVELIVVIVILAILATIAFISYNSITSNARDSKRVADIANIGKALEVFRTNAGKYPDPDGNITEIMHSGAIIYSVGSVGERLVRTISSISEKPTDPLMGKEYGYSITRNQKSPYYELASGIEGKMSYDAYDPFGGLGTEANAESAAANSYIRGNYNGLILKAYTGGVYYGITSPTISPAESVLSVSGAEILSLSGKLLMTNNPDSGSSFSPQIVWTGSQLVLSKPQPFIDSIQSSFSGLSGESAYISIVNLQGDPELDMSKNIFTNYLGGEVNVTTFTLSSAQIAAGIATSTITDNCKIHPESYISSDMSVATISGNIITGVLSSGSGATSIIPVGGDCGDSEPKALVVVVPVDGACGSDNGKILSSAPINQCTPGSGISLADGGIWGNYTWTCPGSFSGSDASCSAMHSTPSFTINGSAFNARVRTISTQADGKIIAGGQFTSYNGVTVNRIARLNPDGSLDSSFNIGTGFNIDVYETKVLSDGKIIAAGLFTSFNGNSRTSLARLNSDGSLDAGFVPPAFNSTVSSMSIHADGKIAVGGLFTSPYNYIAKLNSDGSLDAGFIPPGTGFSSSVNTVSFQSDGKLMVGGQFGTYNGSSAPRIIRLTASAAIDPTFSLPGTGVNDSVHSTAIQADGKILLGGMFYRINGIDKYGLARVTSTGSIDSGFNNGFAFGERVSSTIAIQPDGKIIVYSYSGTSHYLKRLMTDGSLDATFAPPAFNSDITDIIVQPDGKLLIGGSFTSPSKYLIRLKSDGTLDQ